MAQRSTLNARRITLLFTIIFLSIVNSMAQSETECGTANPQDLTQIINYVNNLPSTASLASSFNTEYEIPINLILVTDGDGAFYFDNLTEGEIITKFTQSLEFTNSYFTDNYHFSLCTHLVSAPAPDLSDVTLSNDQNVQSLATIDYSLTSVNCYLVNNFTNNASAEARFPFNTAPNNMIALRYSLFNANSDLFPEVIGRILAHELGHYLGLLHSNAIVNPNDDCLTSGDLMCSTPPDPFSPGNSNVSCIGNCLDGFDCTFSNTMPVVNYIYENLQRNNIMLSSPGAACPPVLFEDDQLERMRNFLFGDPHRWNLVQSPTSSCRDYLEKDGFVYRPRVDNGMEELDPFVSAVVDFDNISSGGIDICNPITNLIGLYSINNFFTPCGINAQTGDLRYAPLGENPMDENFDYLNGVTTLDIIRINKHILGTQELESPFQKIAADVNNSSTITTLDIIRIRKLILRLITEFEEVDSWRFVPALGEFDGNFWSDFYADPFSASWTAPDGQERSYLATNAPSYLNKVDLNSASYLTYFDKVWSFYAVKSGDVNGSARVGLDGFVDEGETFLFTETKTSAEILSDGTSSDEVLLATVSVGEGEVVDLAGYQFSVNFDDSNLELLAIEPGKIAFSSEDFVVDYAGLDASIRTLWINYTTNPVVVQESDDLFTLVFRPKYNLANLNGLISFGGATDFKDLIISSEDKLNSASLQVKYSKATIKDFVIKEAYGNPFTGSGNLHLKIEMKELKEVTILLQDQQGQTVMLDFNDLLLGDNDIEIPASTVYFLQNGSLFYTIATDEYVKSGTIIKME